MTLLLDTNIEFIFVYKTNYNPKIIFSRSNLRNKS